MLGCTEMPKEQFELIAENAGEIVDTLVHVTAALENCLLHSDWQMTHADRTSRRALVAKAQALLERIGVEE